MGKCSMCGKSVNSRLLVNINNNIILSHEKIDVKSTICKDCISKMYNYLEKAEKKLNSEQKHTIDSINKVKNHLLEAFTTYCEFVHDNTKDSEISISKAIDLLSDFMYTRPIREEHENNAFQHLAKLSIEMVYEHNNYSNIDIEDFDDAIEEAFIAVVDSFIDDMEDVLVQSANAKDEFVDFLQSLGFPQVTTSVDFKEDTKKDMKDFSNIKFGTPSQIKKELDKYVIGQEKAKKIVSVAIYNHYKRLQTGKTNIKKSNIMLVGETGCGKTEIARTVAKILNVPFAIADATSITAAGYVGDDVENMLLKLIQVADGDVKKAEQGIIYIDEIDKIARTGEGGTRSRDVGGEGVQQALLKIVEGCELTIPIDKKNPMSKTVTINTDNILFICGGAFEELTMTEKKHSLGLGFNSEVPDDEITDIIDSKAIVKCGMIPELVGRFPIIAKLEHLSIDDLARILIEPENSVVKQYTDLIGIENVDLKFTNNALKWIATKAYENKTGARGLKTIIEDSMLDLMYDLPDETDISKIKIDVKNDVLSINKTKKRTSKTTKIAN